MIKFNVPPYIEGTEKYVLEVMRSGEIAGDNKYTKLCDCNFWWRSSICRYRS